jgi:hypothetical protein
MLAGVCDLCGAATRDSIGSEHGRSLLCEHCIRLVGEELNARVLEETGSLAAVAIAQKADEAPAENLDGDDAERSALPVASNALPATPTLRIPSALLSVLVRDLDGQFTPRSAMKVPAQPTARLRLVVEAEEPVAEERPPKRVRLGVSLWTRGIMASTGVSLAIMFAFLSSKSTVPKPASLPTALANEAAEADLRPVASVAPVAPVAPVANVSPSFTRPSTEGPATASTPGSKTLPSPAPAAIHRAPPPHPRSVSSAPPATAQAPPDAFDEAETHPDVAGTPGPVPEFGGRE